jgi:hypothetical protein
VSEEVAELTPEQRIERCREFVRKLRGEIQNEHDGTKDVQVRRVLQRLLAIKP